MKLEKLELVHEDEYLNKFHATYLNKKNESKIYEIISRDKDICISSLGAKAREHCQAVGIVALSPDKTKILLSKEFRLACNEWVYNFPGGLIDNRETAEESAERELREETGLNLVKILEKLEPAYTAIGISNETSATIICIAEGNFAESSSADEEIEAHWYSKEEIMDLLKSGAAMSLRTQSLLYMWTHSLGETV